MSPLEGWKYGVHGELNAAVSRHLQEEPEPGDGKKTTPVNKA